MLARLRRLLTCLANTSRVMKKMKRDTEPIVFRSFSTPGLDTEKQREYNYYTVDCILSNSGDIVQPSNATKKTKSTMI